MTRRGRPSTSAWVAAAALAVQLPLAGCASRTAATPPPVTAPPPAQAPASPPTTTAAPVAPLPATTASAPAPAHVPPGSSDLARELDALFAAPTLQTATVSALVQSLDTGEILYRHTPDTIVVPASNQKIVTMAVAAARLGWDYRYETRLEALTAPQGGVLRGDLFVVGTGDPSINARGGDALATYRAWAGQLKAAGITRITGRLVGDDDAFDDEAFGTGWTWDDFAYGYAAPIGALQFHENLVYLRVMPGPTVGAPATLTLTPAGSDIVLDAPHVATVAAGTPTDIDVSRFPGRAGLRVTGAIAVDSKGYSTEVAVDNPTRFTVTALRGVLRAEGIAVDGDAVDIDDVADATALKASAPVRQVLRRHQSEPLSEIAKTLMKISQNLYAETVFRTLALRPGPASAQAARERVSDTLRAWGLIPSQFAVADGSGLSRLNFTSATAIVRILRAMARDPKLSGPFADALAIAGRDGTIANRMRASRAEGNAIAKTGTLTSVRSLSGYVKTASGERLMFAFLVNNFLAPASVVDAVVDQAVERLANHR